MDELDKRIGPTDGDQAREGASVIATGGRGEGGTERGVRMRSAWINMSNDKESARPSPQGFARAGSTHHENTISFTNSTGDAFQDTCPDGDDVYCCPGQGLKAPREHRE